MKVHFKKLESCLKSLICITPHAWGAQRMNLNIMLYLLQTFLIYSSFLLFAPLQRFDFLFMIKTLGNERCCSESNINRPLLASWKTLFFVELSNIVRYDLRAVHFDKRGVITLQQ